MFQVSTDDITLSIPILDEIAANPFSPTSPSEQAGGFPSYTSGKNEGGEVVAQSLSTASFSGPLVSTLWEADRVPGKAVANRAATSVLVVSQRSGTVQVISLDDVEGRAEVTGFISFRVLQDDASRALWLSCLGPGNLSVDLPPPQYQERKNQEQELSPQFQSTASSSEFTILSPERRDRIFSTVPVADACFVRAAEESSSGFNDDVPREEVIAVLSTRFAVGFVDAESLQPLAATGSISDCPTGTIAAVPDGRTVVVAASVGGMVACVTLAGRKMEGDGGILSSVPIVRFVTLRVDSATAISSLTVVPNVMCAGKQQERLGCWTVYAANFQRAALIRLEGWTASHDTRDSSEPPRLVERPHVTICADETYRREDNAQFSLVLAGGSSSKVGATIGAVVGKEPAMALARSPRLESFGLPLNGEFDDDDDGPSTESNCWIAIAYPSTVVVVDPAFMDGLNVVDAIENVNDCWFTGCQWADVSGALALMVTKSDSSLWIYEYRAVEVSRSAGAAASKCLCRVLVDVVYSTLHGAAFVHCADAGAVVAIAPGLESTSLHVPHPSLHVYRIQSLDKIDADGCVVAFPYASEGKDADAEGPSSSSSAIRHAYVASIKDRHTVVTVHESGMCCVGLLGGDALGGGVETVATPPRAPLVSAVLVFTSAADKLQQYVALGHEDGSVGVWHDCTVAALVSCHTRPVTYLQSLRTDSIESDLVSVSVLGGTVVFHKRESFAPLLRLQAPTAPLTAAYWDPATDAVMVASADSANVYDAATGFLHCCVDDDRGIITAFGVGRVNFCHSHHKLLKAPCSIGRVVFGQQATYAVNIKLGLLLEVLGDKDESGDRKEVPQAAMPGLSFLLPQGMTDAIDALRGLLQLPLVPYPRVAPASLRTMFGADRKHSALHMLTLLAVLRLLEGFPSVADAATAAIQSLLGPVIDSIAKAGSQLHRPCVVTCVSVLAKDQPALQFAGRNAIHATVRTLTEQEVTKLLRQVDSAPLLVVAGSGGGGEVLQPEVEERAKGMLLFSKVTLVVHALRCHAAAVDLAAVAEVTALVEAAVKSPQAGPSSSSAAAFLSSIAEGWPTLSPHFADSDGLLVALFEQFCAKQNIANFAEYRTNAGAKALTTIAALDLEKFLDLCEARIFRNLEWRPSFLTLVTRIIQTYPGKVMPWFPRLLGFVWKAIDPHSPRKAEREKCFAPVGVLFRLAVHALPNVAFHQAQQRLSVGHVDGHVSIFDVKSTSLLAKFQSHPAPIACVAYSVVDNIIAVVSVALDEIRFWRPQTSGNLFLSFLSGASDYQHFVVAASVPIARSAKMQADLAKLDKQFVPAELAARKCRLTWLSPSCVELSTPWHDKEHVHVLLRMA